MSFNQYISRVLLFLCCFLSLSCNKEFDVPQSNWDLAMADPRTVINLNAISPGSGVVTAQRWDIGTGINGYFWQAPGAKAVLLFHAGYSDYPFRWVDGANHLIPHLLSNGISVYAIDARGHGYSIGTRGLLDVEEGTSDHLVARTLLKKQSLPVFLMGHSLGGLITISSLAKTQEGVAGVISMSSALDYEENSVITRFFSQTVAAFASGAKLIENKASDSTIFRGALTDQLFQNDKLIYRGDIPMRTLSSTLRLTRDNPKYYKRITVPMLIIHGTQDKNTRIEGSKALYDGIKSLDKSFYQIEGAYHSPLDDERKNETLNIILTWLKERVQ